MVLMVPAQLKMVCQSVSDKSERRKIANSYAAAQIRNKHVKEGIALYQENFKNLAILTQVIMRWFIYAL